MQIDFRKILIITLGLLWLWLTFTILYGCSANYHFGKFLKKGGTIDTTERIISVEKVIKVNGKDSIILVEMPLNCPEVQIPPTRTEIRYKYKLDKRKLKAIEQMYNDSIDNLNQQLKYAFKTNKTDKKAETKQVKSNDKKDAKIKKVNIWIWFWIGLGIGILIPILFKFVIKKI